MDVVRRINEIGRRARLGPPSVEDYLRGMAADPTTAWFTELLREKNTELENERQRADQLTGALRAWHRAKRAETSDSSASEADSQLENSLRAMGIIQP